MIDFNSKLNQLEVYPNPTKEIINIRGLTQNTDLSIYTIEGRLVQKTMITNQTELYIGSLVKGVYNLVFTQGNELMIKKITVQ